jgi:hypothetical protein
MSVSRANSTSTEADPSRDVDTMRSTPRTCWMADSRGAVRNASTASGDDPNQFALTVRRGSEVSGSSSTGMLRNAATPSAATVR